MEIVHKKTHDITWATTFNANLGSHGHIGNGFEAAKKAGYDYVSWNGWVYEVNGPGTDADRLVLSSELPR